MKIANFILFLSILFGLKSFAQNTTIDPNDVRKNQKFSFTDETSKRGIKSASHIFSENEIQNINGNYVLKFETPSSYTAFGIAWDASNEQIPAGNFKIAYANEVSNEDLIWGKIKTGEGETVPSETSTGMYWSELFFSYDETARKQLFIIITPPEGVSITKIKIDVMDLSGDINSDHSKEMDFGMDKSLDCPAMPTIILREQWCGTYTACTNASYTPTVITPTHVVIHHGASPDTYTDGYAVVRSYWNYHVNSLAWSDIGYNYLMDKFGNLFLGRKNASFLTQDVRGSHAGLSNSKSIGVNFLGNGDVTQPTQVQLDKCYALLAWWFKSRNIDPLSSASLSLQSGGTATLQRIIGHKDTNIGGTACPGTVIYGLLGTIRTQTSTIIANCEQAPVTTASNLSVQSSACPSTDVSFSWTNSGTGWYIQLSTSSSFTSPYIKYVSGLTSYTGPTGFVLQADMTTALTLSAGQTYFWRIWDNTSFKTGTSFTTNAVPAYPGAISGTTSVCVGTAFTYTVPAVNGATSYNWTIPNGATINSGQGTTSVSVTFSTTSGNVAVSAVNACGASSFRTFSCTTVSAASRPASISGSASVCSGASETYSCPVVTNASSYTWTVPSGFTITSGQGTNSIQVTTGTLSGDASVSATNSCGTSSLRTIALTSSSTPNQPGAISGASSACTGAVNSYSINVVSGATTYTWTVPTGSVITAGQGTTSIQVTAGSSNGNISVSASNLCGTSSLRTLAFSIGTCLDIIKPVTAITTPTWATTNFTANFTDTDEAGGSGINHRFYQVTDLNGTERRSNSTFGFFNDNFNTTIHSDWTTSTGTWSIVGGKLNQTNQISTNTNIYASVNQTIGNQYLYTWKMSISGTGTNRRAGLHFFCEDASQSNRLNSYMVYFRADGNTAQIYEYLNNTMYLRAEAPCTVTPGTTYDYKVILNTVSGEINVYQNDVLKASWTDTTPLTVGNQISLRTGECTAIIDDIRVFKSRGASASVSVGNGTGFEIRYQNNLASDLCGRVTSITTDVAKNISTEKYKSVKIDFWGPYVLNVVRDGLSTDIATQIGTTSISANWDATTDPNNTISLYQYAIGTTPGGTNITNWTSTSTNLSFTKTGLNLTVGTTYYVSIRSKNAAGLYSSVKTSNGVTIMSALMPTINESIVSPEKTPTSFLVYPNPATSEIQLDIETSNTEVYIFDQNGQQQLNVNYATNNSIDISNLPNGTYFIGFMLNGEMVTKPFIKQ